MRLTEHELDAAIRAMEQCRKPRERFCCDGLCNENQGRGDCPRYDQRAQANPPSEEEWRICDYVVYAVFIGCITAAILTAIWRVLK